jgi:alpha-mannosidase
VKKRKKERDFIMFINPKRTLAALPFLPKLMKLKQLIYKPVAELSAEYFATDEPVPYANIDECKFAPIKKGEPWGGLFKCAWFRVSGKVPDNCVGKHITAVVDIGGEGCIFENGAPVQGLTHKTAGIDMLQPLIAKKTVEITESSVGGETVSLLIDAGDNGRDGRFDGKAKLMRAELCETDDFAKEFYYDYVTVFMLCISLNDGNAERGRLKKVLDAAYRAAVSGGEAGVVEAKALVSAELEKKSDLKRFTLYAVGHAHLDLIWLWPLRETKRKSARTYASALKNFEKYGGYVFGSSQPQQFEWMKDNHPELYGRIKRAVKDGRIELQGGMWTEPDVNMTSGESLIRQVYYGKKFFKEDFGTDVRTLWLGDTFGFSAQLPQIAKKTGLDYFMTIKMTWNEQTEFPYNSFVWEALDGSAVLAHIPPEGTYNSDASPEAFLQAFFKYKEKDRAPVALLPYGIGDGGGGPNEIHLEFMKRLTKDGGVKGLPPIKESAALTFFKELEKYEVSLNHYKGELYLEKHQGTLTTQAKNKLANRRAETAFHNVEFLAATAAARGYSVSELRPRLDVLWKEVLLYQFHDVLPGSSINRVYKETAERYKEIFAGLSDIREELLSYIAENAGEDNGDAGKLTGFDKFVTSVKVADFADSERSDNGRNAELSGGGSGQDKNCAVLSDGENKRNAEREDALYAVNAAPFIMDEYIKHEGKWYKAEIMPYASAELKPVPRVPETALKFYGKSEESVIENSELEVRFSGAGYISSVRGKRNGIEYANKMFNRLVIYTDSRKFYDAWDIDIKYPEKAKYYLDERKAKSYIDGAAVVRESEYKFGAARIRQRVVLKKDADYILFETEADWSASHKMLRADFYPSAFSDKARFDVQFGNIERNTGTVAERDYAQFEVCAHKWTDVSDAKKGFGVSLLNDCKYGHRVKNGLISLNLLRSPKYPDRKADIGRHNFTYALYPHEGGAFDGKTVELGYFLNNPPIVTEKAVKIDTAVLAGRKNIVVETVKPSFDGTKTVLRLFENSGAGVTAGIKTGFAYKKAYETDMLENTVYGELNLDAVEFKPYEIKTIVLE